MGCTGSAGSSTELVPKLACHLWAHFNVVAGFVFRQAMFAPLRCMCEKCWRSPGVSAQGAPAAAQNWYRSFPAICGRTLMLLWQVSFFDRRCSPHCVACARSAGGPRASVHRERRQQHRTLSNCLALFTNCSELEQLVLRSTRYASSVL